MTEKSIVSTNTEITLPSPQELIEAGVHFGHKTSKWHPKMEKFIFTSKNDVYIFDLEKTLKSLQTAAAFLKSVLSQGGEILFVGTKPASKSFVKEAGQALGQPYVSERWLGGTLTNFKTISKRLEYLRNLEEQKKTGGLDKYTKKEKLKLEKLAEKMDKQLGGIKNLRRIPEAVFVSDMREDSLAIKEAKRMRIPVVAICDTNNDPTTVDFPIPANDDASSSIKAIIDSLILNLKNAKPLVKPIEEK
jgi:small subunit ribosomal protein S2